MIFGQNQEISVIVLALASNNVGLLGLDCTSSRRAAAKAKPKNEGGLQLASHLQRRAVGTRTQLTRVHMVVIRVFFCHGVINCVCQVFSAFIIACPFRTENPKS